MPRLLYALSFGNFAIGAGAFMVAALVAPVAAGMNVTLAEAGRLLAVYAAAYAVASPLLITALSGVSRRVLLVGGVLLFAAGAALCAVAPSFILLEAGRIVMALGASVFTPSAAAAGAMVAAPEKRGEALALVFLGLSLAQVFGVPAAGPLAEEWGWRAPFIAVAALAVVIAAVIALMTPKSIVTPKSRFSDLGRALRRPALIAALAVITLQMAANFVLFTYMGPLLATMTGLDKGGVALLFWAFGVCAVAGAFAGGWLADRMGVDLTLALAITSLAAVLAMFNLASGSVSATTAAVCAFAFCGFAINAPQQARIIALGGDAAGPALALNASALYVGTALGGAAAGAVLAASEAAPTYGPLAWIGVGLALAALAALGLSRHWSPGPAPMAASEGLSG